MAPQARAAWSVAALAWAVPLCVAAWILTRDLAGVDGTLGDLAPVLFALAVGTAVTGVGVVPQLRWRRWRWELHPEELDLRSGAFTEVRTLVPVSRVQHVEVRRTPLGRAFGVASVVVHTAAGTTELPLLCEAEAARVRDELADLARTPDDL